MAAPSSRGEETLLSPSPLPNSMATSAEPDRDGADSRTDGPTKASEQIRASTSMSTFMSCASRIFVGAPKGVAGTAVSGRQLPDIYKLLHKTHGRKVRHLVNTWYGRCCLLAAAAPAGSRYLDCRGSWGSAVAHHPGPCVTHVLLFIFTCICLG